MAVSPYDPLRVPAEFWQRGEVVQALTQRDIGHLFRLLRRYCGASQTRIGIAVSLSQGAVSPIMNGHQEVIAINVLERIANGLDMPDDCRRRLGLAAKEEDPMKRRTALNLGLLSALSPAAVTTVLRESAAEAMDFTASTMTSVGTGTLDHLEAVVLELDHSYNVRSASELLPVARTYRHRVEQLLGGKHTIPQVRELYLRAANLSDLLSDLAHDLGSPHTAAAWAIDSDRHAQLAGHNEASAWARSMISVCSRNTGRPAKALAAAEHGLSTAPRHTPIAARLYARAAQGHAWMGNRPATTEHLAEARKLCDQLPDESPSRFTTESSAFTSCKISEYAANCYLKLADYQAAEREARNALAIEPWSPGAAGIAHLDLAIALAHLGSPEEAVEHGRQAISQPRFLGGVLPLAHELDTVLTKRYPTEPCTQEFHEQHDQLVSRATTN
jgi:tetratricopeptide (TPR) repeat protein